jgi:hypothetical protein
MSVKVKGLDRLVTKLDKLASEAVSNDVLKKAVLKTKANILIRTNEGKDFKGKTFEKYTDQYKTFRANKGRGSKVDLQFERQMLNSMTTIFGHRTGKITFTRPVERAKAYYNTVKGVGKKKTKREFFRLSKKNKNDILKEFQLHIKGLL